MLLIKITNTASTAQTRELFKRAEEIPLAPIWFGRRHVLDMLQSALGSAGCHAGEPLGADGLFAVAAGLPEATAVLGGGGITDSPLEKCPFLLQRHPLPLPFLLTMRICYDEFDKKPLVLFLGLYFLNSATPINFNYSLTYLKLIAKV